MTTTTCFDSLVCFSVLFYDHFLCIFRSRLAHYSSTKTVVFAIFGTKDPDYKSINVFVDCSFSLTDEELIVFVQCLCPMCVPTLTIVCTFC